MKLTPVALQVVLCRVRPCWCSRSAEDGYKAAEPCNSQDPGTLHFWATCHLNPRLPSGRRTCSAKYQYLIPSMQGRFRVHRKACTSEACPFMFLQGSGYVLCTPVQSSRPSHVLDAVIHGLERAAALTRIAVIRLHGGKNSIPQSCTL